MIPIIGGAAKALAGLEMRPPLDGWGETPDSNKSSGGQIMSHIPAAIV
jgi:hypothetical protein